MSVKFPASPEAEDAFLGLMMQNMPGVYETFGDELREALFHDPFRKLLCEAMIDMHVSAIDVELVSTTRWLRERDMLEKVGGPARLAEVFGSVPFSATMGSAKHWFEELQDMALRRLLLAKADLLKEAALDYTKTWKEALETAESELFNVHAQTSHKGMVHVSKLLPTVAAEIEKTLNARGHVTNGFATGFTALDRMTMGIQPGVFVIGARPSMGKTAAMMQIALNGALGMGDYFEYNQEPQRVGVFSLETNDVALVKRGLLNLATLNLRRVRDGLMSRTQQDLLKREYDRLFTSGMYVEACYGLSIQDFRAKARMYVKRYGLKALFIDYLQLMTSTGPGAKQSKQAEIGECSVGIKHLAHELQVPIFVLAQLNRDAGETTRPKMHQLKDCGQIEQDADYIGLLCDAPESASANDPEDCPWSYLGFDLVKQKDGPTTGGGEPLALRFDKEYFRLTSLESRMYGPNGEEPEHQEPRRKTVTDEKLKRGRGRPRKDQGPSAQDTFPDN